jgi:RNA polymerase sigma-70 factor (ECF subfamily)
MECVWIVQELDQFLASIEKRAFRMAMLALHNEADALDVVQEAMIKLVKRYADRSADEWKPLFLKILENRITDWHRKNTLQRKFFFWRQDLAADEHHTENLTELDDSIMSNQGDAPFEQIVGEQMSSLFMKTIEQLPLKQQQCFLLRSWEGLSVNETASALGMSENTVKTHYFRAIQKLREDHLAYGVE